MSSDPAPAEQSSNATPPVNLGLWGMVASGKTTYLNSLYVAILQEQTDWLMVGCDDIAPGSSLFLSRAGHDLCYGLRLPAADQTLSRYCFRLIRERDLSCGPKDLSVPGEDARIPHTEELVFCITDGLNQVYTGEYGFEESDWWDYIADCRGIIYLYDPTIDPLNTIIHNWHYLAAGLSFLYHSARRRGKLINRRLPHYIAACLVKYDEPHVLNALNEHKLISVQTHSGHHTPLVTDPMHAFELMADSLTRTLLARYFLIERTQFFAVSSVGFYTAKQDTFDLNDCYNVLRGPNGPQLRSPACPVGVIPPLLWAANSIGVNDNGDHTRRS